MTEQELPKILIVDDEEAILETMTFTFMDAYEVLVSNDAEKALRYFETDPPIAVVLTDQRMPRMSGVEFLREVYEHYPETVRIMLTGFADTNSTIQAINDGHVYAYVSKPWEPVELKQIVKRAVELHQLSMENKRLLDDLGRVNVFLEAVMDRLETGAIALDPSGVVQAANKPARSFLSMQGSPVGQEIGELLRASGLGNVGEAVMNVCQEQAGSFEDLQLRVADTPHRLRISSQELESDDGQKLGRVILFKEVSHEPLRRSFDEQIAGLASLEGGVREHFVAALESLATLSGDVGASQIASPSMAHLSELVSRTRTAIQSWLDVDELLGREDYPDAQLLIERMRVANDRWPHSDELPERVRELGKRVEAYYESGENPKERVL
jgi:CheY-like chemotaxis protein